MTRKDVGGLKTKFLAKVSKMGEKIVIVVPMDYHDKVKPFLGKRVRLEIEDEVL